MQNCPHPRLMEGGRLLWCAGLCVSMQPHMHLSVWARVCVCVCVCVCVSVLGEGVR